MRDWREISPVLPDADSNPFYFMTLEQFTLGLDKLQADGLRLPYGAFPASRPGGVVEAICTSWARWRTYEWNPPEFLPITPALLQDYGDTDSGASPKPSWAEIRAAFGAAEPEALRDKLLSEVDRQAQARIAIAYVGRPNRIAELTYRVNGRSTAAQDTERERLVAVAQDLQTRIWAAATVAALEAIDVTSDSVWAPP